MPEPPRIASAAPCAQRRGFLRRLSWTALGLAPAGAVLAAAARECRALSFVHTHTGEQLSAVYFESGRYRPDVLARVNILLRDFRTERVHPIDPLVLDRLHALQTLSRCGDAFEVISGYRSPATNAALRGRSSGVAEHSLHMEGRAIDVRLRGFDTARLAMLARGQRAGGVGYYRVSDFVHVDTGRVRIWGDPLDA
jgi:uncharacterized protein YcbK (DUF882 family)